MSVISETLFFSIADVKVCLYLFFKSKGQVATTRVDKVIYLFLLP
jgi:hypothetical protein